MEGIYKVYELPLFLVGRVDSEKYKRWLARKASALVKRDRARENTQAIVAEYKKAIHDAVLNGGQNDFYTGEVLNWEIISTYDNEKSATGKHGYKKQFALLPTVDHIDSAKCEPDFVICSWRTNDSKNDLSYSDFISLCDAVLT